jgi:hypothetical protein
MDSHLALISELSRELRALTNERPPSYDRLWKMVATGDIPGERWGGPRGPWAVRRSDVPAIGVMLGIYLPPGVKLPLVDGKVVGRAPYMTLEEAWAALAAATPARAPAKGRSKAA